MRSAVLDGFFILLALLFARIPLIRHFLLAVHGWGKDPFGALWFLTFAIPYSILGMPRQALCVAGGLGFGALGGIALAALAYQVAAVLLYTAGRLDSRLPFVKTIARETPFVHYCERTGASSFGAVLALRLMPVGSAFTLSLGAGYFKVNFLGFFLATFLGGLPQTLIFVLAGHGLGLGLKAHWLAAVLLGFAAVFPIVAVGMRYGKRLTERVR